MKISPLLTWGHVCTFLVCSFHIIIIIRVSVASITSSERAAPLAGPNLRLIPSDLLLPDLQQAARTRRRGSTVHRGGWGWGGPAEHPACRCIWTAAVLELSVCSFHSQDQAEMKVCTSDTLAAYFTTIKTDYSVRH